MTTDVGSWRTANVSSRSAGERLVAGGIFGLIGSIPMGMIAMLVMWIVHGDFWAPMKVIAATFLGQSAMEPENAVLAIVIGGLFHMFNGMWLGALFGLVTPQISLGWSVVAGIVFGIIVAAGALWVVLPIVNPVMVQAITERLGIGWWFVVHVVFGLVTGLYPLAHSWGRAAGRTPAR